MPCILTGAGLLFCSDAIQTHASVYSAFCRVNANYIAHATKRRTELYSGFSCDCASSTVHDTRPTQVAIIPPAPLWSISQHRSTSTDTRYKTLCRTLYRSVQPPYYNKVYKGAAVRSCYRSMPDGAAYRRPCQPGGLQSGTGQRVRGGGQPDTLHPAGQSSSRGTAGGAEPLTATAVPLFGLSPDSQ